MKREDEGRTFTLRLSGEDDKKLNHLAEYTRRPRSNVVRVLLSLAEPGPRRTIVFGGDEAAGKQEASRHSSEE